MKSKNDTIILVYYPEIKTVSTNIGEYTSVDISISNFSIMKTPYSEEELQSIKERWNAEGHLLDGEAYVNRYYRGESHFSPNPDFPNNLVNFIKDKIGTVDFIFIKYTRLNKMILEQLDGAGIKYCTAVPNSYLLNEWIGRLYQSNMPNDMLDKAIKDWDSDLKYLNNCPGPSFTIESNEYLDSPGIHHFQGCRGTILDGIYNNCIRSEYTNKPDQFAKIEEDKDKENDYSRD